MGTRAWAGRWTTVAIWLLGLATVGWAAQTTMVSGTWVMNNSAELVAAQINGKSEVVCLPKLEFAAEVDKNELYRNLKEGVRSQEAIFHLFCDDIGHPKRVGGLLFASDVFLKDLKMTFIGYLRGSGFKFKVSKMAPFEDPAYLRDVQSGGFIRSAQSGSGSGKSAGGEGSSGAAGSAGGTSVGAQTRPAVGAPPGGSGGAVGTSFDVLPAGVLHPSVRRMRRELEAKIREIKTRPFKKEIITVDPVRWASGRMGTLTEGGAITEAQVEGQKVTFRVPVPAGKGWWKPAFAATLAGQACEFVLQRGSHGREIQREGAYLLADVYLTDLGQTWAEWWEAQGLALATPTVDPAFATGPVTLKISVVPGVWQGLPAGALVQVAFPAPPEGVKAQEFLRIESAGVGGKDFAAFQQKVVAKAAKKNVQVSLLMSPDGQPYTELGQKRAARMLFSDTNATLGMLFRECAPATGK